MTTQEINEGIKLICKTSKIIQDCYESKQALVDEINNAKKEDIEKCWNYYKDRSGVVVDARKELFKLIREGKQVTVKLLDDLVAKHKQGKENQFRVYKNFYTIFYPAITFYGHNRLREFIKYFENKLIVDLGLENEVKTTSFDFQGPRQQGSDRYWLAIYNKEQQNQSTGIQFFIDFHHGNMSYGVYKHGNRDYLKDRVVVTPETFNYDDLLVYFKTEVNDLMNDLPKYDNITSIDLGIHNLYKISHGTFKAKNKSHVIETLKENNWVILHENTGKDQSRYFKEDLHEGDYIYITLGSKELIGIAKIVSEEWDYVPYEIVEADGWMFREVEFIKAPVRKNPKDLKDSKNIFPSGNSTLTEIKFSQLEEANDKLFKPYFNVEFYNSEIVTNLENDQQKLNNVLKPLNQILYGPPGTGKTHRLKNEYFSKYTLTENSISPEVYFEDVVNTLTWWQVIALALIEIGTNKVNEILENRWVAKKAQLSESKNVRATIWGTLQMHTIVDSKTVNYTQRQTPFIFDKTEDKKWQLFENDLKEQAPEIYDILDSVNNFKPNPNKEIKHYVFTTFHQSFSYEDFIEGIKPVMEEGQENVTYKIENGIFKELCLRAQNDPTNRYAIFIDEINRGNVSQIFGELITLIEHDKRIGAPNEIRVKLPYSKKEFGVPINIDIIGTMNTADRSVEALDTALRRRFSFFEMMPDEKIFDSLNFADSYDRKGIMQKINQRIEVLLDRNYTLGHSYFIKKDFKNSFENEIIPLLQEYFYNDYGKIGLVLGKGFVREKAITAKNDKSIFADFETKNEVDINKSYELIPFTEINFDEAIQTLLA